MLCSIIWQVLQLEYSLTCFKSYFNKWKKLSIGIDFGIGIDQNSWYRYRYRPKKLVSPITIRRKRYNSSSWLRMLSMLENKDGTRTIEMILKSTVLTGKARQVLFISNFMV